MLLRRPLRALQVEPTTRCTRSCAVCPRTVFADRWRSEDLDPVAWGRLRTDLRLAQHLHLQGWGEPLLHPRLRDMVRDATEARCRVGLTTNGDLLEENASWIIEDKVDLVTVSVAGAASNHARLRDGSNLKTVYRSLSALARRRGRRRPKLQVSYLLTADNAEDLADAVQGAAEAGADEVFVIHLDVTLTAELAGKTAFSGAGLREGVDSALDRAADRARRVGIRFREPARRAEELLSCALDPTRFAFVSCAGVVTPCVNLGLPIDGRIVRFSEQGEQETTSVEWGDLHTQSLQEILAGDRAEHFRAPFYARKAAERRFLLAQRGWGVAALQRLERAARQRDLELARSPFPSECEGCPKAEGW